MRTLTSTLHAAQRSASAVPHLEVILSDRDVGVLRTRWERWYAGSEADGPCAAAVPADGALLRARIDPTTGSLSHQRVAVPTSSSTYSGWTSLGDVAATPRLGFTAVGTRALLVTVRGDGVTVEVRDSSDAGATFGASAVVAVAGGTVTAVAGALLTGTGTAAVFYAVAGTVYVSKRTGLGAWSAPAAWTPSLATVSGITAIASTDYDLVVSGTTSTGDAGAWSFRYGAGVSVPAGVWTALVPITIASAGTSVAYLVTGVGVVDVPRVALVEAYSGGGGFNRVQLASGVEGSTFDASLWRDPVAFEHSSAYGLGLAGVGNTDGWLVAPHGVWHAALTTTQADLTADVLEGEYEQAPDGGRLRLRLRNDHGRFPENAAAPALEPGNELRVSPGYITTTGAERSLGPQFWITRVTRRRGPGSSVVEVEAVDASGVLAAWHAPRQLVWPIGTAAVDQIMDDLIRRAGFTRVGGMSTEALTLQPGFTVRAGENGAAALRRLLAMVTDVARPDLTEIAVIEPLPGDATDYEYGTVHAVTALATATDRPRVAWARVLGSGVVAEAVEVAALSGGGSALVQVDDSLTTQARVDARAATLIRQSELARGRGQITVPVNAGQEVGDVIEVTDATLGLAAARFRVAALRLRFVRGPSAAGSAGATSRPRYDLTLTLSEV